MNGSGKTTCFYAIAGLIDAEAGQVMVDGRDVSALPMYRRANEGIGYLPQEMSIFRGLNVEDNILAILEISTPRRDERQRRLEELLTCACCARSLRPEQNDSVRADEILDDVGRLAPRQVCQYVFKRNDIVWICRT